MHPYKPYETKFSTFQKKHFRKLCAASQLVCTCAFRRVVATKDIVHKEWNSVKQI